jgi:hypothetical protein
MQNYVAACARQANSARIGALLDRIIPDPAAHARFVNTLARLEYVGVRKILKSRRSERLDLDGLQHILDEAVHALRLKKAAALLADKSGTTVQTFAAGDTLAGDAGEAYLQGLDRRAEAVLAARREPSSAETGWRGEANYLLTSAAIEVRAQVFYPLYESRLRAHAAPFSVAMIGKDEDRHLAEMAEGLEARLGAWRSLLEPVLAEEDLLFGRFLDAIDAVLNAAAARPSRRGAADGLRTGASSQ